MNLIVILTIILIAALVVLATVTTKKEAVIKFVWAAALYSASTLAIHLVVMCF